MLWPYAIDDLQLSIVVKRDLSELFFSLINPMNTRPSFDQYFAVIPSLTYYIPKTRVQLLAKVSLLK